MLSTLDRTYAEFEGAVPVKVGESYLIYKSDRSIHHPRTGEMLGYQTTVLGSARVTRIDEGVASLVITASNFPIDRLAADYDTIWALFRDAVSPLSADEQRAVLRGNAERIYRI